MEQKILNRIDETIKRILIINTLSIFYMIGVVYLCNEWYLKHNLAGNSWMPMWNLIIVFIMVSYVLIGIFKK